jgi:hypothetical protein
LNASHLVDGSSSLSFTAVSPGGFSALAVTAPTWPRRLPGSPGFDPLRFAWTGWPSAASTVLVAGCGSADSNEELKLPGGADALAGDAATSSDNGSDSAATAANRRSNRGRTKGGYDMAGAF